MAIPFLVLTGAVIVGAMAYAYSRSRDSTHPMVFFGLLLLYVYAFRPVTLAYYGVLQEWFSADRLLHVVLFRLASVSLFCLGCIYGVSRYSRQMSRQRPVLRVSPGFRGRAYMAGAILGMLGMLSFLYVLFIERGGLTETFSSPYAFKMASSGYLFESRWLGGPAVLMLAFARRGQRLRIQDIVLAICLLSPLWLPGVLGAKRGPSFYALCVVAFAYFVWRERRPTILQLAGVLGAAGVVAIFLVLNRSDIYIGSSFHLDFSSVFGYLFKAENIARDEEFISSGGAFLTAERFGRYGWGALWVVMFVIRPIPRQIWPTKYEDCGFDWLLQPPGQGMFGYSNVEWMEAAGFQPAYGCAYGFETDFFLEFSWGSLIFCYLLGLLFAWMWKRERAGGGLAQIVLITSLALAVYLPTQGAVQYFFFWSAAIIPTVIMWRFFVQPPSRAG